MKRDSILEHDQ